MVLKSNVFLNSLSIGRFNFLNKILSFGREGTMSNSFDTILIKYTRFHQVIYWITSIQQEINVEKRLLTNRRSRLVVTGLSDPHPSSPPRLRRPLHRLPRPGGWRPSRPSAPAHLWSNLKCRKEVRQLVITLWLKFALLECWLFIKTCVM